METMKNFEESQFDYRIIQINLQKIILFLNFYYVSFFREFSELNIQIVKFIEEKQAQHQRLSKHCAVI